MGRGHLGRWHWFGMRDDRRRLRTGIRCDGCRLRRSRCGSGRRFGGRRFWIRRYDRHRFCRQDARGNRRLCGRGLRRWSRSCLGDRGLLICRRGPGWRWCGRSFGWCCRRHGSRLRRSRFRAFRYGRRRSGSWRCLGCRGCWRCGNCLHGRTSWTHFCDRCRLARRRSRLNRCSLRRHGSWIRGSYRRRLGWLGCRPRWYCLASRELRSCGGDRCRWRGRRCFRSRGLRICGHGWRWLAFRTCWMRVDRLRRPCRYDRCRFGCRSHRHWGGRTLGRCHKRRWLGSGARGFGLSNRLGGRRRRRFRLYRCWLAIDANIPYDFCRNSWRFGRADIYRRRWHCSLRGLWPAGAVRWHSGLRLSGRHHRRGRPRQYHNLTIGRFQTSQNGRHRFGRRRRAVGSAGNRPFRIRWSGGCRHLNSQRDYQPYSQPYHRSALGRLENSVPTLPKDRHGVYDLFGK